MGRPPSIRKSSPLEVSLDEELRALLDIRLWSQVENRVPKGAYKTYLDRLLAVDLKGDRLDLAPYAGTSPGAAFVTGSREAIAILKIVLEQQHDT